MGLLALLMVIGCITFWVSLVVAIVLKMNLVWLIIALISLLSVLIDYIILIYLSEKHS